jgi:hypothetical protein
VCSCNATSLRALRRYARASRSHLRSGRRSAHHADCPAGLCPRPCRAPRSRSRRPRATLRLASTLASRHLRTSGTVVHALFDFDQIPSVGPSHHSRRIEFNRRFLSAASRGKNLYCVR